MDKVIVTALLIIAAVTSATVVLTTVGPSVSRGSQSVLESQNESATRIRTSIEIIAATADSTGTSVDAWVKNVGLTPIDPIEKSDVFVITPGTRFDGMTYSSAGGDNTWVEQPLGSSWNRGDTLHLKITLPAGNPLVVGDHIVRVSTPNGVVADKTFSR